MRGVECIHHHRRDPQRRVERQRPLRRLSFQVLHHEVRLPFRTDVEVEKMGGGPQTAAGATAAAFDDSDFRRHWQTAYGQQSGVRYEDYLPAYQYGYHMAGDERYSKFRWSDVEPDVQKQWESTHAGSPWERFKDAIRYGWERVTR